MRQAHLLRLLHSGGIGPVTVDVLKIFLLIFSFGQPKVRFSEQFLSHSQPHALYIKYLGMYFIEMEILIIAMP